MDSLPKSLELVSYDEFGQLDEVCSSGGGTDSSPRIGTPAAFRDLLLTMARTASKQEAA